jgi:hypothetical protein
MVPRLAHERQYIRVQNAATSQAWHPHVFHTSQPNKIQLRHSHSTALLCSHIQMTSKYGLASMASMIAPCCPAARCGIPKTAPDEARHVNCKDGTVHVTDEPTTPTYHASSTYNFCNPSSVQFKIRSCSRITSDTRHMCKPLHLFVLHCRGAAADPPENSRKTPPSAASCACPEIEAARSVFKAPSRNAAP